MGDKIKMLSILCNYCPYPKEYNIDLNEITEANKDNFCEYYFCHKAFQEYLKEIKNKEN